MRGRFWVGGVGIVLVQAAVATAASAAVTQTTTGEMLPRPVEVVESNLVNDSWAWNSMTSSFKDVDGNAVPEGITYGSYYAPPQFPQFVTGDAITLSGAFKWRAESIDPVADARTDVGDLTPHCALSVEVVLVGGICQPRLAWYNVTGATAPAPNELHELVPAPSVELSCKDTNGQARSDGFCPLGWDNRSPRNLSIEMWEKKTYTFDLSKDERYAGGAIAFAISKTAISTGCGDTVYSAHQHGPKDAAGQPYVSALVYDSKAQPGTVYVAFEDGKMPANDWHNAKMTDGDFNDYVVRVAGCFNQAGSDSGEGGAGGASDLVAGGAGGDSSIVVDEGGANDGGKSSQSAAGEAASTGTRAGSGGAASHAAGATSDAGATLDDSGPKGGSAANGDDSFGDDDDSGCGCRAAPRSGSAPFAFAALLFGLALRRRAARS